EPLRRRLRAGPLPADEALALLADVARVLAFAHADGLVHRDLKPENVVVEASGRVKLVDFGLAAFVAGDAPLAAGTPGYRDPTIPGAAADPRADVYAFGVLAFESLRGRLPIAGEAPSF